MTRFEGFLIDKGYSTYVLNCKEMKYQKANGHIISTMVNLDHRYIHNTDVNLLDKINKGKSVYGDDLTTDLDEFNNTFKCIALQFSAGREGISLKNAKYIVALNIDFSATTYWQFRDRMTTMDRLSNDIYWIFSKGGIEEKVYKAVLNKKSFTLSMYKKECL